MEEKSEELVKEKTMGDRGRDAFITWHGAERYRAMDSTRQEDRQDAEKSIDDETLRRTG